MAKISILIAAMMLPVMTASLSLAQTIANKHTLPGGNSNWKLAWSDEFDYPDQKLDKRWISQNGPNSHILSSRWRENAVVENGALKLINKKEQRGGQEWTSGSIWTKEQFQYGYFECRYKYAAATGTNNSFWLMTQGAAPKKGKKFEIDINEGHYPNEINTNIHNWSDFFMVGNKKSHYSYSKSFHYGTKPDYTIQLEIPVVTRRIRFTSNNSGHFNIGEFRIYNVNEKGYPNALSETADTDVPGLINFARDASTKINVSGVYKPEAEFQKTNIADGNVTSRWTSQKEGEKWIEFEFNTDKRVGCVQFINGWINNGSWTGLVSDYKVQYWDGKQWIDMVTFDIKNGEYNFAKSYHIYGLEWNKEELVFYFDGKEIRRTKNEFCFSPAPVYLSLAIIPWAGAVTDAVNGTSMEVDYVRVYKRK